MTSAVWRSIERVAEPYYQNFNTALDNVSSTQKQILQKILHTHKSTTFGQRYNFANMNSMQGYQETVPINSYEDIKTDFERMAAGESYLRCHDPVLLFEETSGTHAKPKWIPYTNRSLEDFRLALFPWIYDLCHHYPGIMGGSAYWSISPVAQVSRKKTHAGIPIGMTDDSFYFGEDVAQHIQSTLAVPAWISSIPSVELWRYLTLFYLLRNTQLSLISIWSPTFLLQILQTLSQYQDRLIADIQTGNISHPEFKHYRKNISVAPDKKRANVLKQYFLASSLDTTILWPKLNLVSCWASGASATYAHTLKKYFPNVRLQAKGLLATEGVITIPMVQANQPVLSVLSGFYEFLTDDGNVYLAHELTSNTPYSVLLTNNSGLYRYNIGDRVKLTGWYRKAPCLEFISRASNTVDLCGEKLTEEFLIPYLADIPGFSLVAPRMTPKPHYCLYVDSKVVSISDTQQLAQKLEILLRTNPQYDYARHLDQLGSLRLFRTLEPLRSYQQYHSQSKKLGDIKPPGLSQDTTWHQRFTLLCKEGHGA